jgi:hypothetical protein
MVMSMLHPRPGPHPVHTVHRVSAAAIGGLLILFAVVSFARGVTPLSTHGLWVMGLSSDGPLAMLSVVVGLVLIGAASRSGPAASSTSIVLGVLFLLSGLGNTVVLGTAMNVLAFRLSNIIFSLVIGLLLLMLGSYGRISGSLPPGNPYRSEPTQIPAPRAEPPSERIPLNRVDAEQLAEAERAAALHYATSEQLRRVSLVHAHRSIEDRLRAWRSSEVNSE